MQTLKYCPWSLSHPVQDGMGATCFWSVTHAAHWTMWNRSPVSSCQPASMPYTLSPCFLGKSNLQTAAFSIRSDFLEMCGVFFACFFFCLPEVGELSRWEGGREGWAEDEHELCFAFSGTDCIQVYISSAVGVIHTNNVLPAEVSWTGSAWPVGPKSIKVFSQLMNCETRNVFLSLPTSESVLNRHYLLTFCSDLKRKQSLFATNAPIMQSLCTVCVHRRDNRVHIYRFE